MSERRSASPSKRASDAPAPVEKTDAVKGVPKPTAPLVSVEDYHTAAYEKLPRQVYDYYASGARDEVSLQLNRSSFERILLLPRILRDVRREKIELPVNVLGSRVSSPIMIAGTAMHKMATPEGEIATVQAAAETGTLMMLSSLSTTPLEEVAHAAMGRVPLWFQLYILKDRAATMALIRRAEVAGFAALAVTVDSPVLGIREMDVKNKLKMPEGMSLAHYDAAKSDGSEKKSLVNGNGNGSGLEHIVRETIDASVTWADVAWLKKQTHLPIILKGVHVAADAAMALELGLDGIVVSNHGARQVDTVPGTIELLPPVIAAVRGRMPVWVDGGVRRGTDVFKALALGACGVFVGRPILWGLAVQGKEGVKDIIRILNEELVQTMQLCGTTTVSQIDSSYVCERPRL